MPQPTTSFQADQLPTRQLHGLLLGAIAPRPIAFVSTIDARGRVNLSPFSFFNVFGSNPPLLIFSPARRVRDNTIKHTLENVQAVAEAVVNIVDFAIVEQMSLASTEYGPGVNEFVKAGLTQVASESVQPPRVGEAPVAMECRVRQVIETGSEGGAGNLVIAQVERIHVQSRYLTEDGSLDLDALDLVGRMGGNYYVRASGSALFEIPKPIRNRGIGIDALPAGVRSSSRLTGNQLARLGNLETWPTAQEAATTLSAHAAWVDQARRSDDQRHRLAARLLDEGQTGLAAAVLTLQ